MKSDSGALKEGEEDNPYSLTDTILVSKPYKVYESKLVVYRRAAEGSIDPISFCGVYEGAFYCDGWK